VPLFAHAPGVYVGSQCSAEAGVSTDGLPLEVPERSFALRPSDGKVCPIVLKNSKIGSGEETRQIEIRW